jgi:uncharacterized protein
MWVIQKVIRIIVPCSLSIGRANGLPNTGGLFHRLQCLDQFLVHPECGCPTVGVPDLCQDPGTSGMRPLAAEQFPSAAPSFVSNNVERAIMTLEELRTTSREEILRLATGCGAANVRVFSSVARGENDSRSDVDHLVDLEPGRSLLDLARLQRKLEQLLTVRVDVVSARGLRDRVREAVLRDALPL